MGRIGRRVAEQPSSVSKSGMKTTTGVLAAVIAVVSATGFAQQTGSGDKPLAFEAASIKPNTSGATGAGAMGPPPADALRLHQRSGPRSIAYTYRHLPG